MLHCLLILSSAPHFCACAPKIRSTSATRGKSPSKALLRFEFKSPKLVLTNTGFSRKSLIQLKIIQKPVDP